MQTKNRLVASLGIPFTALLSILFGFFLIAFPIGIYVVFETNIGQEINYEFPITKLDVIRDTVLANIPLEITIGDVFVVLWSLYVLVFVIAILGPKKGFLKSISSIMQFGKFDYGKNYMIEVTKWFSILVLVSAIINYIQESFGIITLAPNVENNLIQFFFITASPLFEEIGFRVILIGIPLILIYSYGRVSIHNILGCLWNPGNLGIDNYRRALILIILVGLLFGMAHIAFGQSWSEGKFAQATASGIILGWVYVRYGFVAALLIHWATNYFIHAYANMVAQLNFINIQDAFSHSLMPTIEIILLASGIMSVVMIFVDKFVSNRTADLEV